MKENTLEMTLLLDCYGELLTEKQRNCFDLYYNDDFSLSEIAENLGISRQGVRDLLLRAGNTLTETEARIGMVARLGKVREAAALCGELLSLTEGRAKEIAQSICSCLEEV